MSIKKRVFHGFFFIFSGRVGAGLLTIVITPILVRLLGSSGYGDYAFALAVYSTLRTVSGGGIYEGARKYLAEDADSERRSSIFRYYLNIAILFGSTVSILLALGAFFVVEIGVLDERLRNYLYVVALLVFLHPFYYLVRSSLMGFELEKYSEPLVVLDKFFFGVIGLSLAYVGFHVLGVLLGHVLALVVISLLGAVAIFRYTTIRVRDLRAIVPDPLSVRESNMFRYSVLTIVFVSLTKSLYTVDILLLQPFSGSTQVGYYRAALVIAEFLWFVPLAIQIILLHSSSKLWYENRIEEINAISSNITRYTLLLTGFMAVAIATVGDSLLALYFGAEFTASYLPLVVLLPGVISFAVARPIYAIGQGHGNMKLLVYSTGGAATLNLAFNLLLIPRYGIYGAAVSTSIGYGSMLGFHTLAAHKMGFHPLRNVQFARIALACLLPIPVLAYLDHLVGSDVLSVAFVLPLGFVVFALAALVSGAVSRDEVTELKNTAL